MTTIARYTKKFAHYLRKNSAVSALEYAILVGIIATAMGVAVATFTDNIETALKTIGDKVGGTTMTKTPGADPN